MSLTADIKTLLTGINVNIYRNDRPDTPNDCITIYHTGGQPSIHAMGIKQPSLEKPTFQVDIRNKSFDAAIEQAEDVKDTLNGLTKQLINNDYYEVIFLEGDVNNLGKDDRERSRLTINFVAWRKRYKWILNSETIPINGSTYAWIDTQTWTDDNIWKD